MNIMKNIRDVYGVAFVLIIASFQLFLFAAVDNLLLLSALSLGTVPFLASISAYNHHHHHNYIFKKSWLNRAIEIVMFFQSGISPFAWTLHHNLGHHVYYLDQKKDPSKWQKKNGETMGRWYYGVFNTVRVYSEVCKSGRRHKAIFRKFRAYALLCSCLIGLLLFVDVSKALIVYVIPMVITVFVTMDTTYGHHAGLSVDDHLKATNNNTNKFYNIISWNLGYHTAHHMKPGIHWSQLPQYHQSIEERIPDQRISPKWLHRLTGT